MGAHVASIVVGVAIWAFDYSVSGRSPIMRAADEREMAFRLSRLHALTSRG